MSKKTQAAQRLIQEVRRTFQVLRELSDSMNRDVAVTASMRSVMETLCDLGPRPVPEIATEKHVSRQHVQKNVDELVRLGLVRTKKNPAHKRSVLIELTAEGRAIYECIRDAETELLNEALKQMQVTSIKEANDTLLSLRKRLECEL